jgi:hypothetical protein
MKKIFSKLTKKSAKILYSAMFTILTAMSTVMMASAAGAGGAGGGGAGGGAGIGGGAAATPQDADTTFLNLINFFAIWFGRIGLVVGFVGAIMFALAIKDDNADGKQRGLMTMIAGFVVFAVTVSLDLFGLV